MTKDPAKPCGFQFCNPIDCSGHGECKADQMKCVCDAGWSGEGCGVSLCPDSCNGRGICQPVVGGKKGCASVTKVTVAAHVKSVIIGKTACSNRSQCDHSNMLCACAVGFNGPHCNQTYCGKDGLCSNHGICNTKNTRCDCHPGYDGELCSHKVDLAAAPEGPKSADSIIPLVKRRNSVICRRKIAMQCNTLLKILQCNCLNSSHDALKKCPKLPPVLRMETMLLQEVW